MELLSHSRISAAEGGRGRGRNLILALKQQAQQDVMDDVKADRLSSLNNLHHQVTLTPITPSPEAYSPLPLQSILHICSRGYDDLLCGSFRKNGYTSIASLVGLPHHRCTISTAIYTNEKVTSAQKLIFEGIHTA
jgi:hypothetical protein